MAAGAGASKTGDGTGTMFKIGGEAETFLNSQGSRAGSRQGWAPERQGPGCYSSKPRAVFHIVVDLKHHLKKVLITSEGKTQKP